VSFVRDYIKRERSCVASGCAGVRRRRSRTGAAIAEFGPALFILFFFALFPAVDLIGVGLSYCSCMSLVDLQLREACKIPRTQALDPKGSVQMGIPNAWRPTVMGGASSVGDYPVTQVEYNPSMGNIYVTVTTTFYIHPLLQIPFFPNVPAIGAPFVTTIAKSRILENPAFAAQ